MSRKQYLLQLTETKLKTYSQNLKDFPNNPIFKLKLELLETIKKYIMENIKDE